MFDTNVPERQIKVTASLLRGSAESARDVA